MKIFRNIFRKAAVCIIQKDPHKIYAIEPNSIYKQKSDLKKELTITKNKLRQQDIIIKVIELFMTSAYYDVLDFGFNKKKYGNPYLLVKKLCTDMYYIIDILSFDKTIELNLISNSTTNLKGEAFVVVSGDSYEIVSIDAFVRRKGYGSILLKGIIKYASKNQGKRIYGEIWPENNRKEELDKFYCANGFDIKNGKFILDITNN